MWLLRFLIATAWLLFLLCSCCFDTLLLKTIIRLPPPSLLRLSKASNICVLITFVVPIVVTIATITAVVVISIMMVHIMLMIVIAMIKDQ